MGRSCIDKTHAALEMAKGNEKCNIKDMALKKRLWPHWVYTSSFQLVGEARGNTQEELKIVESISGLRWQRHAGTIQGFNEMAPEMKLGLKRAWLSKMWEEADTIMSRKRR
eukprot:2345825-Amphidinium_carterae.1